MKRKSNVGKVDQIIRYMIALVFLVLGIVINPLFIIGTVVMILTAYFKFCGLYRIFGINTCKIDE
ncbi:MAG: DUF2892 domain-containing protein [Acholeplasmataceae bacterium]|jgi:hypothetical protein|nr:DUF2892 domain-containing protein [Acholeplasmataceae bacterium]